MGEMTEIIFPASAAMQNLLWADNLSPLPYYHFTIVKKEGHSGRDKVMLN